MTQIQVLTFAAAAVQKLLHDRDSIPQRLLEWTHQDNFWGRQIQLF